jgi:O-acetyl-ADP-ribose deacetylase (regulator of RNase III)
MEAYKEINGDLFEHIFNLEFDVIAQGCNCFNNQGAGIALQFVKYFKTNEFKLEKVSNGDINKLGLIDYELQYYSKLDKTFHQYPNEYESQIHRLYIVNCYTQYHYGKKYGIPFDYDAFTLCMKKINFKFKNKKIGLPMIGAGLAGGNWNIISNIIKNELKDCYVTIIKFEK